MDAESAASEPIAVVGMSCRLPGADGPVRFWELLCGGEDAIGDVPEGRWPDVDRTEFRRGGFLPDVDRFDAAFFGISPNEAAAIDPQQRLFLELSWEALEHARITPAALRDTAAAVFAGVITGDYGLLHVRLGAETPAEVASPRRAFLTSLGATASNPLTIASWAAVFSAASTADLLGTTPRAAALVLGVGMGTLTWFTALSAALALGRRRAGPRVLIAVDGVSGSALLGFATLLAYRTLQAET